MGSSTSPGTPEVYELIPDVFPLGAVVPLAVCCESIYFRSYVYLDKYINIET